MTKREGELKSEFLTKLTFRFPEIQPLQFATAGAPDRCIPFLSKASFWEFKHGTPGFELQDLQLVICMRLEAAGVFCRYVIWREDRGRQETLIVRPTQLQQRALGRTWQPDKSCIGFDHDWLIDRVLEAHS